MIQLFRGDDSDFADLNEIVINIDTDLSLEGFTGCFCFLGVTREFTEEDIARKTVTITYSAEETARFIPGLNYGKFTLIDPAGRKAAVQKVMVEVLLHRMCSGCPEREVTITIENQFDYNTARNKPMINGEPVQGDKKGSDYGLNRIPEFSERETYKEGDQCLHERKFYICVSEIDTPRAWNAEQWQELGGTADRNAVHYTADVGKTEVEKEAARQNIGAASVASVSELGRQVTEGLDKRVKIEGLKKAIADPKGVKLAAASIKEYLQTIYDAIQAL